MFRKYERIQCGLKQVAKYEKGARTQDAGHHHKTGDAEDALMLFQRGGPVLTMNHSKLIGGLIGCFPGKGKVC
jgi:hypothetical protein